MFAIDVMPASQQAEIERNHYERLQLPTQLVAFTNPLPEGYEPSPSHLGTYWRSNSVAAAAGGRASDN
jgi:hypothetical protein